MRFALIVLLTSLSFWMRAADAPQTVLLWPDGAPEAKGTDDKDKPSLTLYPAPADNNTGASVIVAPGGGYYVLAIDHEGQQVARWFNRFGVSAYVLKYRLKPKYDPSIALLDGKRAVRWVRANADHLNIDPKRVGMLGFSAGAHLTACIAIQSDTGKADAADAVEKESCRPDYTFMIYGGATVVGDLKNSGPNDPPGPSFTKASPPAFLMSTNGDKLLPRVLEAYKALQAAGVDSEFHVYGGWGPHGLGLGVGETAIGTWPDLAHTWMRRMGFLTALPRAAVTGTVTVDGKLANRAWVTFIPTDSEAKPIAATHFGQNEKGVYKLAAQFGPSTGTHRVEIRLLANTFGDNPSIEDAVLFTKATPDATEPLQAEIKPGENTIDFNITTK
jgi:acetyl esterase/lipase